MRMEGYESDARRRLRSKVEWTRMGMPGMGLWMNRYIANIDKLPNPRARWALTMPAKWKEAAQHDD